MGRSGRHGIIPFSYSLKLAPGWRVNRMRSDQSFLEMHESHKDWLRKNRVTVEELEELEPDNIPRKSNATCGRK